MVPTRLDCRHRGCVHACVRLGGGGSKLDFQDIDGYYPFGLQTRRVCTYVFVG